MKLNAVPLDQLSTAQDAFRIILQQVLKKLSEAGQSQDDTSNTLSPNVSVKQVFNQLRMYFISHNIIYIITCECQS